jgi:TonB family protein
MYLSARGLLDSKDREGAIKAFTEVVAVAGDPDLKQDKTAADIALLANGFLELSRALPAPAKPPADPASTKTETPAGNSDPSSASARRPAPPVVSPPQPIRQDLPRWSPPATLARAEYKGRILVHVSPDGKVASAEILDSVHPLYDELLLTASKGWSYKPGMSNGAPVPADHIVEVVLKPRQP